MKQVDVVIPTYNETRRLLRAVESVLSQTYSAHKIYVVEDGSSLEIVSQLHQQLGVIRNVELITMPHIGYPGILREIGISKSQSHWIAFLDADDYWQPDKLLRQIQLALKHNLDLVFTNATEVSMLDGKRKEYFSKGELKNPLQLGDLLKENLLVNSSVLVKRKTLLTVGGMARSKFVHGAEDYATWLRVASVGRIGAIDEQLVVYEKTTNSFSRQKRHMPQVRGLVDFLLWTFSHKALVLRPKFIKLRWAILSSIMRVSLVEPFKSRTSLLWRSN